MREPEPWHRTWMSLAHLIARRSKDTSFQAGAVLVGEGHRLLGTAYNGPAPTVEDGGFDWTDRELKRSLVCHAESNCLWFAVAAHGRESLFGSVLFVNGFPCSQCMKEIVRAGVRSVVWDDTNPTQPKMCDDHERRKTHLVAVHGKVKMVPYSEVKVDDL